MTTKRNEPVAVIEHVDDLPEWATTADRTPIFAVRKIRRDENGEPIRGDDGEPIVDVQTYDMPAKPNPSIALRFLKMARQQGELASSWLIEQAIGSDGYDALADELESAVERGQDPVAILRSVSEKIQQTLMGGLDAGPKA